MRKANEYINSRINFLLNSPEDCRSKLVLDLNDHDINSEYALLLAEEFNLSKIKASIQHHKEYVRVFPTVFKMNPLETDIKIGIWKRIKLRLFPIKQIGILNNKIEVSTLTFVKLHFIIQLLVYIRFDNGKTKSISIEQMHDSTTSIVLKKELGNNYSRGKMLDYIDQKFDLYKHTHIPSVVFRNLYFAFGNYVEEIGNMAFDNFMENRDARKSWKNAIVYFLINKLHLNNDVSVKVCDYLYNQD